MFDGSQRHKAIHANMIALCLLNLSSLYHEYQRLSPEFTFAEALLCYGDIITKKKGIHMSQSKKIILTTVTLLVIVAATVCSVVRFHYTAPRRNDFQRIDSEVYDSVLLSMFPVSTYPLDLFYSYRRMTVFAAEYVLPDLTAIYQYMDRIQRSGNDVRAVYLGFLPDKVSLSEISELTTSYPNCYFELIIPCPFRDYWENLSDQDYSRVLEAYCSCLSDVGLLTNARLYCYAPYEWIITNPALYKDTWLVSEDLGFFIVANSYGDLTYLVTEETSAKLADQLRTLTATLRSAPPEYPDHSDITLIFLGDSIFGNFSGGMSIPGIINGLTGAAVYNLGLGGSAASKTDRSPLSLPEAVTAFFTGNPSVFPEEHQAYSELTRYCSSAANDGRDRCYVINVGLNDYFDGCPVRSEDPWDSATYTGAIRAAVALIREHSPESQIILCTPNYSPVVTSVSTAGDLKDYADAVLALAGELNVDVVDNFYGLGINAANYEQYLADTVHPNESCRFRIAQDIIKTLR